MLMSRVRIAPHVVYRTTTTDLKMLFDRDKGVMYELNETASSIVALLQASPQRPADLVDALSSEYAVSRDDITEDVGQFVADFLGAGVLEPVEADGGS
jgi:hypothetical protein